jgi:hypothetical protein
MIVTNYPSPLGPDILSFCWSAEVTRGPRDDAGLHANQEGGGGEKATKEKNGEKGNQNKGKQKRKRKMGRSWKLAGAQLRQSCDI